MPPLTIILWSAVRYGIMALLTWAVSRGVFSKEQADAATPELVNLAIVALTFIGLVSWSYLQKWYNGWKTQNQKIAEAFEIPFRNFPSTTPTPTDKIDK